ncbi:MAG: molybdopterin molybdotransferase MoeA [Deltaproteobacteria bacterium]|nr:molybdopterin molybdotransferase MoeA [Deltaproteobacteria bacterium]
MRSIAEALQSMLPAFPTLGEEEVPLTRAAGRYLASDIVADLDSPAFDNSAMDGYAVRAAVVASASTDIPVRLRVSSESRTGGDIPSELEPGTVCRIFTGATMPPGADAVVIQEDTKRDGEEVDIFEASTVGRHVRARGSDVRRGETILRQGDRLWPGEIGLLASQNVARMRVYRQPRVALLSTGDELETLGEELAPGKIINSNVYVLGEMLGLLGAIPDPLPAARDDLPSIEAALRRALEADVVITIGGVSVGAYDLVHEAFQHLGIDPEFWKVRIKPGKPLAFAQHHGKPVIGLPGNPISAMVTFEVLVAPCLRQMLGDREPHPQPLVARLQHAYHRRPGRVEIARGVATRHGDEIHVSLHKLQGSGSLPSFVGVNALVILPSDRGDFNAGDQVDTILWGSGLRGPHSFFDSVS